MMNYLPVLRGLAIERFQGDYQGFADATEGYFDDPRLSLISAKIFGAQSLFYGDGVDNSLSGSSGSDFIYGQLGDDTLAGGSGSDTYIYFRGDGNDTITEAKSYNADQDTVILEDILASEVSLERDGNDVILRIAESAEGAGDNGSIRLKESLDNNFGQGVEDVVFADGTTWSRSDIRQMLLDLAGTDGDDDITGFNTADTIDAGAGDDTINGGGGADTYIYFRGDGNDTITEAKSYNADQDTVILEDILASEVSLERDGNDVILRIAESAEGAGDNGSIRLKESLDNNFGQGVEDVVFADGTTWSRSDIRQMLLDLAGTDGDDDITGFNTADTIDAGAGDDTINGGGGADTYIYFRGDGNDTITEAKSYNADQDTVILEDILASEVSLERDGNDVILRIAESAEGAGDNGSIRLKESLDNNFGQGVEDVVFADGTTWSRSDIRQMLLDLAGTDGDDDIAGSNTADMIDAGAGDDTINGGGGADTYIYFRGDGNDTITEAKSYNADQDTVILEDILASEVSLERDGNDVILRIAESAEGAGDNGSIRLKESLDNNFGQGVEDVVFADGTTWSRSDIRQMLLDLAGTDGDDDITGFNTADTIDAGAGDDTINGGGGADTYIYFRGDGNDTITEAKSYNADQDTVILEDILASEVSLERDGNDVILRIAESAEGAGDNGSIRLKESLDNNFGQGVEDVVFADGTTWSRSDIRQMLLDLAGTDGDDDITGFNTADTIDAGAGDDTINGGGGADTYIYFRGDGNDTITEAKSYNADQDTVILEDILASEVSLERDGNDVILRIAESTDGAGDSGSIRLKESLDEVFGEGIEKIVFADGTTWSRSDVRQMLLDLAGTDGDDDITGFNGGDTIDGLAGNDSISSAGGADTLTGGLGNDTIDGGSGDDTYIYNLGDGNDVITETYNNGSGDRLELGTGILASEVTVTRVLGDTNDILLSFTDGGSILLDEQFYDAYSRQQAGVEEIVFADGTVWSPSNLKAQYVADASTSGADTISGFSTTDIIDALAGNDTISAAGGDDDITGGAGDDTISGGRGDDLFRYDNVSFGRDTITDFTAGSGSEDVIEFDHSIFADFTSVLASATDNGIDTTITVDADTSIVLKGVLVSDLHQDDFQFA